LTTADGGEAKHGAIRTLTRCRACYAGSAAWRSVLALEPMPLAGQFCTSLEAATAADKFPLSWIQCTRCGLVQVLEDIDDALLFREYNYASSTVGGLVRHFEEYAAALATEYREHSRLSVLEIGCNDGVLLKRLPAGWRLVGIDPSDVARRGADNRYELVNAPFTEALATTLPGAGTFDVVTASNCMAHIHDLRDVLSGVHRVLRVGGDFFIEVHDLDATRGGQWDTIYHEHKAEWSERSLVRCLSALGFEVVSFERLPLHGGLLRGRFRKAAKGGPLEGDAPLESFDRLRAAYLGRRDTAVYRAASATQAGGGSIAAYGASGRANVWLNQLPELRFRYIVDESPLRCGKWIPATGTPIVPREHMARNPPDVCVITAWNYASDIMAKNADYRGRWLKTFED
jgi:novobiocin biosynthesis protein NovU/D-mycarose 3-C-methyltransferase